MPACAKKVNNSATAMWGLFQKWLFVYGCSLAELEIDKLTKGTKTFKFAQIGDRGKETERWNSGVLSENSLLKRDFESLKK